MGYSDLASCVADLERHHLLKRIDFPVDPVLEIGVIQRRVFRNNGPCLLFTRPKGCDFPMLANLYGTMERLEFIFRDTLPTLQAILQCRAEPERIFRHLAKIPAIARAALNLKPAFSYKVPALLSNQLTLAQLPRLVSWPKDGGSFITLPIVQSASRKGKMNFGMYRVQLDGNDYRANECGLHYQIHRGIGIHHAEALADGRELAVNVYVGGSPGLALAAVMPMPEGMSELMIAALLEGRRQKLHICKGFELPLLGNCDFVISGVLSGVKPEGPFGDHLGYYSLRHEFPVLKVAGAYHKKDAIWPFTTVGRPPQEDTIFGEFIHRLTGPMVGKVFPGIQEIHAVDAAGVHPLLLAIGSERYTPYEFRRKPRELLTQAFHLLGDTQTSLAKYLLITESSPGLSVYDISGFFIYLLERANFERDLHFIANSTCDTLDYSGSGLHEGSKLIWASAGEKIRDLGHELSSGLNLPAGFKNSVLVMPGVVALEGPCHKLDRGKPDPLIYDGLACALAEFRNAESFPLMVVTDDSAFCAASLENFLWLTFTRSDPATDVYGANAKMVAKSWSCQAPLIIDARQKPFHAPPLEEDPEIVGRVESMAAPGGPLYGLF